MMNYSAPCNELVLTPRFGRNWLKTAINRFSSGGLATLTSKSTLISLTRVPTVNLAKLGCGMNCQFVNQSWPRIELIQNVTVRQRFDVPLDLKGTGSHLHFPYRVCPA